MRFYLTILLFLTSISVFAQDTLLRYYDNGQLEFVYPQKDGKHHGLCRSWYDNGNTKFVGYLFNGIEIGRCVSWFSNGQKQMECKYDSLYYKRCSFWNQQGIKTVFNKVTKSKKIQKIWSENGTLLLFQKYSKGYPTTFFIETSDTSNFTNEDSLAITPIESYSEKLQEWYPSGKRKLLKLSQKGGQQFHLKEWNETGKVTKDEWYKNRKLVEKKI